jgi:tetratricopeptide (TPR) repeat protein
MTMPCPTCETIFNDQALPLGAPACRAQRTLVRLWLPALVCVSLGTAAGSASGETKAVSSQAQANVPAGPAVSKAEQSDKDRQFEQSRSYFQRGVQLFESRDYNAALTEFQRVYDAMAGHEKRYYVLDNIGMCHEKMFHYDLAIQYYERYLKEGGEAAEDRASVVGIVHALKALLGTLEIHSNAPAEVWIDNRLVGNVSGKSPGRILVPGGQHALELRQKGYQEVKRAVQVASQDTLVLRVVLEPALVSQGLTPAYFFLALGGTLAAAGVGAGFGIAAKADQNAAVERARQYGDIVNSEADRDAIRRKARVADVLYGSAALLAVGTSVLFFLTDFAGSDAAQRTAARPPNQLRFGATVSLTPRDASLMLKGSF